MSEASRWSPLGIVSVVGAAVMISGIFLQWGTGIVDLVILGFVIGHKYLHYTGWEVMTDQQLAELAPNVGTVPECTLAIGAVSLAMSILPLLRRCRLGKFLSLLCIPGSCAVIYMLVRLMNDIAAADIEIQGMPLTIEIEIGFWVCMAGAAILLIGSAINLLVRTGKDDTEPETCGNAAE